MMRKLAILLVCMALVGACSPQEVVVIPTLMILPSLTPSETFSPTPTPSNTLTITPTFAETPTDTPTATLTPTDTVTLTGSTTPTFTRTPSNTRTPSRTPTRTLRFTRTPTLTPTPEGDAVVSGAQGVNLREGPSSSFAIIATLDQGAPLFLIGRTADNLYYEVETVDGQTGWVYAPLIEVFVEVASLPVTWTGPTGGGSIITGGSQTVGGFALGGHVLELNANTVGLARRAGMTWVKMQYRYNVGDSTAAISGMLGNARANGFRLLVSIVGQTGQMGNLDGYIASYSQFVGDVAALGIDGIEVWNEPNIDREWPAGQINGANYTRLLQAAYNAIKARNSSVLVVSGAPAPTGFFGAAGCGGGGCNDDVFMQQMAGAGAAQYIDCVGIHYNEGILPPSASSGDPRSEYPTRYFNGMISRTTAAFGSEPICITELGYLSPEGYGPLPGAFAWAADTSVQEHAQWLGDAARMARQGGQVRLMIVWNVDFPFYGEDPSAGYAILRPGGGCPACDTLAAAMR